MHALGVCIAKRRRQSPEWTIVTQVNCFNHSGRDYWISGPAG